MKYNYLSFCLIVVTSIIILNEIQSQYEPTFEEIISLKAISNPEISPDGQHIVFQQNSVDWSENRYDTEIWMSKNGDSPFQLTNNPKSSSNNPRWSPDGRWIAFVSDRADKNQIYVIRHDGGEAFQVTQSDQGVGDFKWSPDGLQIAFLQSEDKSKEENKRKDKYGAFAVEDEEYTMNRLWVIDFIQDQLNETPLPSQIEDSTYNSLFKARLMIDSMAFTINDFEWSPDGRKIAIEHQPDPLINSFFKADISIFNIVDKELSLIVNNTGYDGLISWSPDGSSILYQTSLNDVTSNYYRNNKLFRIKADGSEKKQLAADFDENISRINWRLSGIYGIAWQKTNRPMVKIDPDDGDINVMTGQATHVWDFSFSSDGSKITFTGAADNDLTELYTGNTSGPFIKISNSSAQINDWAVAQSEVISWLSKDGTVIEGVLHKPQQYDPSIKSPLLVIIHGGPTSISYPSPTPSYVYPMVQWLNKGALILRPNYRGSAGYGEDFRSLNVKNLGVGDAWDVLSGVDFLIEQGIVDKDRTAAMGWSQGGYISAFLTTNSDQFKAISVGAGISNWMTYYVNTDIHPFTRQYLKATPWSDKEIYEFTSPMTNINNASTPTLIQHGEFDKRVPIANAYELFQGLQDLGVETKLIVYKGFGHGINKPKERLAATWHNWQWFGKYIWGEEIEIPE